MIISLNWLKKFVDITMPVDELVTRIGARLVEIESIENIGKKYSDVVVVRIVECGKLEGTDHLNVVKVDDGGKSDIVERDENGLIQVVCGAPNVRVGMLVAWLMPGTIVPETVSDKEPFVLSAKNLRGVMSNGMLASAKELDLFDDHSGILEISGDISVGSSFSELFELNDYLFDIENKSLTHRPDTFGIIGFAREVAAITDQVFKSPDWLLENTVVGSGDTSIDELAVTVEDHELSARYQAVVMHDVDADRASPLMIQTLLARVGVRPINAVVDVTNYLMMLTGQPLHAFDYDKVTAVAGGSAQITVRAGRENETLALLDGRTITLTTEDIVIAAGDVAIGLAGAMGGASTVIDASTKTIIIECATFNLYKLRATQMRHGIFSEAITRFTKGQPAQLTTPVLQEAIRLTSEWSGGVQANSITNRSEDVVENSTIEVSVAHTNAVLGTHLQLSDIIYTLQSVEFVVNQVSDDVLQVQAPFWRSDIHIFEDIVEEVGRIRGFDSIALSLPTRPFTAIREGQFDTMRQSIRNTLTSRGANEVLSYSFVHGDTLKKSQQDTENSYRIVNSISPDLQYYRQSLTSSLLSFIHPNIKQGFEEFALFESNKVHQKSDGLTDEGVPVERNNLAMVITRLRGDDTAYYDAKQYLDVLLESLHIDVEYQSIDDNTESSAISAPFEPKRSAFIVVRETGETVGVIGEFRSSVSTAWKLPVHTAGFEVDMDVVYKHQQLIGTYTPLSRYPSTTRDISFQVSDVVSYAQITDSITVAINSIDPDQKIVVTPSLIDIYVPETPSVKNITFRFVMTPYDNTLDAATANDIATLIASHVSDELVALIV